MRLFLPVLCVSLFAPVARAQDAGVTEEVIVEPGTVAVQSSGTTFELPPQFIDSISFLRPGRHGLLLFEDLASVVPQAERDATGFGINGATSAENLALVDGFNVNDVEGGHVGARIPVQFLDTFRVHTGGYQAEFGRAGGGVIEATTKSGTNTVLGSLWVNYSPGVFTANARVPQVRASYVQDERLWNMADFGATVGGPILKDRLWYFAGIAAGFTRVRKERLYIAEGLEPRGPVHNDFAFDDRRIVSYVAKVDFEPVTAHRFSLSVNGSSENRLVPDVLDGTLSGTRSPGTHVLVSLKYGGSLLDGRFKVDAQAGWFRRETSLLAYDGSLIGESTGAASRPQIVLNRAGYNLPDVHNVPGNVAAACAQDGEVRCLVTGYNAPYAVGGVGELMQATQDRISAGVKVTGRFEAAGQHTVKAGADFEYAFIDATRGLSGGASLVESTDGQWLVETRRAPQQLTPRTALFGVFLQDSWAILDTVTLNVGLRYDAQALSDAQGNPALALTQMFSPRAGLVYDFTRKGRSRVFANYARYHQALPLNYASLISGEEGAWSSRRAGGSCQPGVAGGYSVEELDARCPVAVTGSPLRARATVDGALNAQVRDEVLAGLEYEVLPGLRAGATYTKAWQASAIEALSSDGGDTWRVGNRTAGVLRDYDAVTVQASKSFQWGFLAQASYTWSSVRGVWAGVQGLSGSSGSLEDALNTQGVLPQDRTQVFRLYAAKDFEIIGGFHLLLGATYEGRSGTPVNYYDADGTFILERGAGGRTPWLHTFNLKGQASYRFDKDTSLAFTLDFLNAVNVLSATQVDERFTSERVVAYTPRDGENPQEALCAAGAYAGASCVSRVDKVDGGKLVAGDINRDYKLPTAYQLPLQVRLGLKFTF